ncbi:TPA: LamG domain-containing protein [Candidatus Poribacteria bacterium]|nr:LamG domain-containing protein [Candidatus Poribacteria bacterium]
MKNLFKKFIFLSTIIMVTVIFVGFSHSAIKKDAIIGIWLLDDAKGDTAKDSSGNGRDGKANGTIKWAKGKFGGGIEFVGSESINIPHEEIFDFGDKRSFSVVVWFNFSTAQDWNRLVRGRNPGPWQGGNTGWELQTQALMIHWSLDDVSKNHVKNTYDNAGNGSWRHTAMIVDRSKKKMITYLDGENEKIVDISNIVSITSGLPIVIGGGIRGSLDEVAIFDTAITQEDVQIIMNKGLTDALKGMMAVQPLSKLSVTWGDIKIRK